MKYWVLYNPYANNMKGKEGAEKIRGVLDGEFEFVDLTKLDDYYGALCAVPQDDTIVVCGGDGTLNNFINKAKDIPQSREVLYYPTGSGNDFLREIAETDKSEVISLNKYLVDLPTVYVNGMEKKFLNGIGYGVDGYACEVADNMRAKSSTKKINYTTIAIKGLLFYYKPTNATIIVDGKEYHFKKVWIAPTMHGKYYGGGVVPAPNQDRLGEDRKLSVMVLHGTGKLKTLMLFPSLFKGTHLKYDKAISVIEGKEVTVKFDGERALQIDGETVLGVREYTVKSARL